ncbi:MAG: hypothetical protein SFV32_08220 [Opitutaceae bacterium]|nr:hypothetical protein [Opitutaceae bacterium]
MTSRVHPSVRLHRKQVAFLVVAWLLILAKCVIVSWAIEHWQIPFKAGWLIYPTLAFALLATVLWIFHRGGEE